MDRPCSLELHRRALLILTFRADFNPPWIGQSYVTALTLNGLDQCQAAAIVEAIASDVPPATAVKAEIIERADGVPLFVEESTKSILESGGRPGSACHIGYSSRGTHHSFDTPCIPGGPAQPRT